MGFRLERKESVGNGLSRIVRHELQKAAQALSQTSPTEAQIHDARKRIKKARAVIRLVKRHVAVQRVGKDLRRAARLLAPVRDAEALAETADSLCAASPSLPDAPCTAVTKELASETRHIEADAARAHVFTRAAQTLTRARRRAHAVEWQALTFAALSTSMAREYRSAKRRMKTARDRPSAEAFHSWRKRAKVLWYGLRLLDDLLPPLHHAVARLDRLSTLLGDDHNVALLRRRTTKGTPAMRGREQIARKAEPAQRRYRRQALAIGEALFASNRRQFRRRLRGLWRAR